MSNFNKFKTYSYCVGGRHYSRNKSMTLRDATIEA